MLPALLVQDVPAAAPLFAEVGEERLPGVHTTCGGADKEFILEVNGGGLALGDLDLDGDHDLVVVDGSTVERVRAGAPGLPPRLFLNDGAGSFSPADDGSGAGAAWRMAGGRWGMGCATGDADGDGWLDLAVTEWGPDRLFRNREGRGLEEVTARAGFAGERWGTSAAFLDYDRDGMLDLAVVNYLELDLERVAPRASGECRWRGLAVMCGPEGLTPEHDQLYRGRGDGSFEEVSERAGFRPPRAGYGLGVLTLDADVDGDTDLYVSNDSTPNHLWLNGGDGTFAESALLRGVALDGSGREQAGMGLASGDVDRDGLPDLFVTNFSGEHNAFYQSSGGKGRALWRDRAHATGLGGPSIPFLGWGATLADLDLDGDLDVSVFNGHVYPQADSPGTDTSYAQQDHLYRNRGDGRFALEPLSGAGASVSRASAAADLDGDGDLDLVALVLGGPVRVLVNRGARGHWLRVRLEGAGGNTAGLGAAVTAAWEGGSVSGEVRTAGGYQCAVPAEVHLGLGAVERLKSLSIRWPSGWEQVLDGVEADRLLVVREPESIGGAPAGGGQ